MCCSWFALVQLNQYIKSLKRLKKNLESKQASLASLRLNTPTHRCTHNEEMASPFLILETGCYKS
jgi:hypothetical protein